MQKHARLLPHLAISRNNDMTDDQINALSRVLEAVPPGQRADVDSLLGRRIRHNPIC